MHFSSFCADGRPFSETDLERDEWGFRGLLGQKSNENNMQLLHLAAKHIVKQLELTQDIAGCFMNHRRLTTSLEVGFRASVHFQDARQVREGYYVQAWNILHKFLQT